VSDRLYFEPLTEEDVRNVIQKEKPIGAIVQFGGQTAIKLTEALDRMGVKIFGTQAEFVDAAEDREKFEEILESLDIPRPKGKTIRTTDEALKAANELIYPVLVRPSYVLGGKGMEIAFGDDDIKEYMKIINMEVQEHPILVDKYMNKGTFIIPELAFETRLSIPGNLDLNSKVMLTFNEYDLSILHANFSIIVDS
jgi:carbamoyl-phosphate synthase large subunit